METLKHSGEFERVRREGRTWASGLVVLNAAPGSKAKSQAGVNGENGIVNTRCGFIAGKKIGGAVQRNRARRLMKEAVRLRLSSIKPGWDLVWIARAPIAEANGNDVARAVDDLLSRSKLGTTVPPASAPPVEHSVLTSPVEAPDDPPDVEKRDRPLSSPSPPPAPGSATT